MSRPLDGLLVVSLEQAIAAPYCTRLLADQGARVIKVERPDGGDFARAYDTRARGLASHFVWTNRSKESLALDLKDAGRGRGAAQHHRQGRHVRAEPRAGRCGAAWARLLPSCAKTNPRLITCSISGYGSGGPAEKRKAYDLLIQAEAGFLSVTGTTDQMAKAGISIADIAAGMTAYHSILAALINRGQTGEGDNIEVSMLEAMAELMGFPMYFAMDGAPPPPRNGAGHATIYPYGPYDTADGGVFFGLQNDREWAAFAEDRPGTSRTRRRPPLQGQCRPRRPSRDARAVILTGILRRALHRGGDRAASNRPASARRTSATWLRSGRIPSLPRATAGARFGSPAGPLPATEAGKRRQLGAAPRPGARARRAHRGDPRRVRALGAISNGERQEHDPEARQPPGDARGAARALRRVPCRIPPQARRGRDLPGRVHRRADQGRLARRHDPGGISAARASG